VAEEKPPVVEKKKTPKTQKKAVIRKKTPRGKTDLDAVADPFGGK
jgi:hypothetical protein